MLDSKIAPLVRALQSAGLAPAQGFNDYVFGSLAADNVEAPYVWRTEALMPTDLRSGVDRVENQGTYNQCVGEAWTTALEVYCRERWMTVPDLSSLMVYWASLAKTAAALHLQIEDAGTSAFTAASALTETGACTDDLWPSWHPVAEMPSEVALEDGLTRRLGRYERLGRTYSRMVDGNLVWTYRDLGADMLVAIATGHPVLVCLPLSAAFFSITGPMESHPAQRGFTFMGAPDFVGNHAMCATGMRRLADGTWMIELQNSWGPDWGDGGWFGIRLTDLVGHAFDCFTVRSFMGAVGSIPMELRRWTANCTLADGSHISIDADGVPAKVYRLYQAAFCRVPDYGGLSYWIGAVAGGGTMADVAQAFVASPEFVALYGSLDNAAFVRLLYRNVLGREGENAGFSYWTGMLDQALLTRPAVLTEFAESAENCRQLAPAITGGIHYA